MKHLLFLMFLFVHFSGNSQTLLKGKIKTNSGETVPGVNVFLKGTYDGTTSEADGSYSFLTEEDGMHILVFQAMGFRSLNLEIELSGGERTFPILLKETINELTAVTISAGAMEASDGKKSVVLKPMDIVTVPSAISNWLTDRVSGFLKGCGWMRRSYSQPPLTSMRYRPLSSIPLITC